MCVLGESLCCRLSPPCVLFICTRSPCLHRNRQSRRGHCLLFSQSSNPPLCQSRQFPVLLCILTCFVCVHATWLLLTPARASVPFDSLWPNTKAFSSRLMPMITLYNNFPHIESNWLSLLMHCTWSNSNEVFAILLFYSVQVRAANVAAECHRPSHTLAMHTARRTFRASRCVIASIRLFVIPDIIRFKSIAIARESVRLLNCLRSPRSTHPTIAKCTG